MQGELCTSIGNQLTTKVLYIVLIQGDGLIALLNQ
jgi:hypothetical protein